MANAAEPPPETAAGDGLPGLPIVPSGVGPGRGRGRQRRVAAALLATIAGIAVLGFGFARIAGGEPAASSSPGVGVVAPSSQPSGAAGPSPSSSAPAVGRTSLPPGSSPPPGGSPAPSALPPSTLDPAARAARLQATLDQARTHLGLPGVSATVLFPDGTSWTGVSGLADVTAGRKVTTDTAFAYASVSKTFTSALILELVGEGRIHLADSAAALLPPLRLAIDHRITVAMLLDHTSGLPDFFLNPRIDAALQAKPTAAWTVDRTLDYVGKPLSPPGVAWHYANTNYLLLGLIAERVTGEPLATAIRSRLLDPTGLGSTWYQAAEAARAPLAHGYRLTGTGRATKPIDLSDGSGVTPFTSVVTAAGGAGSIAGTSGDLARWARALYGGRVLGADGTALLLSDFRKTTNYVPGVVYGYGVQALSVDGHPSLGHSGRFLGFRSSVRHFPLDGLTIAVLTNQSRTDPAIVVRDLLEVSLPPPKPCAICTIAR